MLRSLLLLLCSGMLAACSHRTIFDRGTVRQLPVQEYVHRLEADSHRYIIDVRTSVEYSIGHLDSAINISYVAGRFKKKIAQLDTTRTVYLYCQTAHRSPYATKRLKEAGFTRIYDLKKGYRKYQQYQRKERKKAAQ